jgi:hypothetical protein
VKRYNIKSQLEMNVKCPKPPKESFGQMTNE